MEEEREYYVSEIQSLAQRINETDFLYKIYVILKLHIIKMDERRRSEGGADE